MSFCFKIEKFKTNLKIIFFYYSFLVFSFAENLRQFVNKDFLYLLPFYNFRSTYNTSGIQYVLLMVHMTRSRNEEQRFTDYSFFYIAYLE